MKEKNFISAVVYVHNAEGWIAEFMNRLIKVLEENFDHSEIICVNDFSKDQSVERIKSIKYNARSAAISILNLSHFHGLEIAMNAGVDLSIGDFVLEIDSTRQIWSDDEIMNTYRKVLEGNDIVSASPKEKQKVSSSLFYWIYDKFSDSNEKMRTESFRILSRRAINRINGMSRSITYRKGVYTNCGLQTANIEFEVTDPSIKPENSNQLKQYRRSLAFETLILFTNAGYFMTKLMTALMMIMLAFMIIYTVVNYVFLNPVEGWTTTVLFLSVAFFGLFAILTIIVKYLQILVEMNFRRTKYSFESIEKLTK